MRTTSQENFTNVAIWGQEMVFFFYTYLFVSPSPPSLPPLSNPGDTLFFWKGGIIPIESVKKGLMEDERVVGGV